jgi:MFS family permease
MTTSGPPGFADGLAQLRDPSFARLFAARFVSSFGTAMAPVAMAFGVLELTGSASQVGLVIATQTAATVATVLFGGALADRWSRKRVWVGSDLLAATSQTAMAFLFLSGNAPVWGLCGLMAVNGLAFAFLGPASVGMIPQVVERPKLQSANALLSLASSGAIGLGGACAGVLVAVFGAGWAIAVDALTFAISAALLVGVRPRPQEHAGGASLLHQLREGWREFTSHRWLWAIVVQFSLLMAAWGGGFFVIGPVVAERALGGAAAWGWVTGAMGVGLVAGGILGMRLTFRRPMLVATLATFTFAVPLLLLMAPAPVEWIAAGAFLAGLGGQLFGVLWFTALHTHVAPEALSRVSAYDHMGSIVLMPLGEAAAGPLYEALGADRALLLAAFFIVVPTLAVLGVREVRTLSNEARPGPDW